MKKVLLLFLLAVISTSILAQSNSIGILGGVNISKMNLMEMADVEHPDDDLVFKSYEPLFGFVGGIDYQRTFLMPITLDVGILFNQYGCRFDPNIPDSVYFGGMSSNITIVEQVDSDFRCVLNYMYIPVLIGYKFGEKFSIIPKIGIHMSYLINKRFKSKNSNVEIDLKNINRFHISGNVEIEMCYMFNKCLGAFACITGKYSLLNYNKPSDYIGERYSLSAVVGLKYYF